MENFGINDFLFDLYQQLSQSIHHNENSTVNSQFETFVDIFQTVVNNHAPLCNASRKQKIMWQKPWFTPGIYKSILTKNKMYHDKVYNKKNTPLYNMYKVYRNNLSIITKVAKQQYYCTLISSNKNDTKKYARY